MPSNIFSLSPIVAANKLNYKLIQDLLGGTRSVITAAEIYLPREFEENDDTYRRRLTLSILAPFFTNNIKTSVGLLTTNKIKISDGLDPVIASHLEDIDLNGNDLEAFVKLILEDSLTWGYGLFLVDYPELDPSIETLAQYNEANRRPFWYRIDPRQVISFKSARRYGIARITELIVEELAYENKGKFSVIPVKQYRVYTEFDQTLYDLSGNILENSANSLGVIPLVTVYSNRLGLLEAQPPFVALAELCIKHYQASSDYINKEHITNVPMLKLTGLSREQISGSVKISNGKGVLLPEGGDAKWLESPSGTYNAGLQQLDWIENLIKAASITPELTSKAGAETADSKRIDSAHKLAFLKSLLKSTEDAINLALYYHANYLGLEQNILNKVEVCDDLIESKLDKDQLKLVYDSVVAGKISIQTYLQILVDNEILPEDFNIDEEILNLNSEMLENIPLSIN